MALSQFTFYFFVAAIVQTYLLIFMRKEGTGTQYLYLLTVFHIAQNTILLAFTLIFQNNLITIEILVRMFYAFSFLSVPCFLSYAVEVCTVKRSSLIKQIENGAWIVALCGAVLSIFTDEIITGYRALSLTVTATRGDNFWIRVTHGILTILTGSVILIKEWVNLDDETKKKHCLCLLIAYTSFSLFVSTATIMMRYGIEASFAMAFPFASTFSLCLIIYGGFKYGWLTSFAKKIPEQHEMSEQDQLNDFFTRYTAGDLSFNEATEKFDLLLLTHAYNKNNGNIMKAAKSMGLGRSTLYKKIQKHKLK